MLGIKPGCSCVRQTPYLTMMLTPIVDIFIPLKIAPGLKSKCSIYLMCKLTLVHSLALYRALHSPSPQTLPWEIPIHRIKKNPGMSSNKTYCTQSWVLWSWVIFLDFYFCFNFYYFLFYLKICYSFFLNKFVNLTFSRQKSVPPK